MDHCDSRFVIHRLKSGQNSISRSAQLANLVSIHDSSHPRARRGESSLSLEATLHLSTGKSDSDRQGALQPSHEWTRLSAAKQTSTTKRHASICRGETASDAHTRPLFFLLPRL